MSCQPRGRTTKFPSQDMRMAMGWPRRRFMYVHLPSKSLWVELGSNLTWDHLCNNQSPWPLYHAVSAFCLLYWWIMVATTGLHLTGDWTILKSLVNSCCKNINQITPMQKLLWKIMLHLLVNKTGWVSKHHNKTDIKFYLTANLVLRTTTTGDKSESANETITIVKTNQWWWPPVKNKYIEMYSCRNLSFWVLTA